MAESSSDADAKPWQFKPGQSGNPGGRAKKLAELTEACQNMTPALLKRLNEIIESGHDRDCIAAMKLVFAYGYGQPTQTIQGPDGEPVKLDLNVIAEKLKKLAGQ